MIGEDIISLFSSLGSIGMLLALTLIIALDGAGIPTLPEIWIVFIFGTDAGSFTWGLLVVLVATAASLTGTFLLYTLVRLLDPPRWIKKAMTKYTDFLIVSDERLLLLNRLAPLVPYTGAFIAVCKWDLRRSTEYLVIGALIKFSAVVLLCWLSYDNIRQELAPWVALGAVAVVITVSIVASLVYKKRHVLKEGAPRSQ